jgi:hypothetical protein
MIIPGEKLSGMLPASFKLFLLDLELIVEIIIIIYLEEQIIIAVPIIYPFLFHMPCLCWNLNM